MHFYAQAVSEALDDEPSIILQVEALLARMQLLLCITPGEVMQARLRAWRTRPRCWT